MWVNMFVLVVTRCSVSYSSIELIRIYITCRPCGSSSSSICFARTTAHAGLLMLWWKFIREPATKSQISNSIYFPSTLYNACWLIRSSTWSPESPLVATASVRGLFSLWNSEWIEIFRQKLENLERGFVITSVININDGSTVKLHTSGSHRHMQVRSENAEKISISVILTLFLSTLETNTFP
jgi:hypothetical protein